ncbi:MAG: hypothetical protein UIG59_03675 [Acutalibacteraceae bacterium]|nr:hypothetical protein [Acutalibacteraceae bacterium]
MKDVTCCFLGHRVIKETEKLKTGLMEVIEKLITDEGVDTFLFGSKSRFNSLCLELVTKLKQKHPHIKRVYVRAEFPIIDDDYKAYLLRSYEETYYPKKILNAGRAAYIERNFAMIDKSHFCIVYFEEGELPVNRKSGTKTALDYAIKRDKEVILFSNSSPL